MHNNEEVLPHFILQLIHLFAVLPPETAFLSIYESGSKDSTGAISHRCPAIDHAWHTDAYHWDRMTGRVVGICQQGYIPGFHFLLALTQGHGWKCCSTCWPQCTSRIE